MKIERYGRISTNPWLTVAALYGEGGTTKLLVLSQVVLSMQLPFAVVPLVAFTSDRAKMGGFANPPLAEMGRLDHRRADHRAQPEAPGGVRRDRLTGGGAGDYAAASLQAH
ncbi:MAG: Manganese transport protein MntH [uncultured Sphingomonas sp.]|uniref:Manganese transport protein MntH n=1 Tax=uncultured Sphingomonas sp. TaxID=158754 RepID=A0A6J4SEP0_9SPHN|nr:divalent metal cation transporter [uncultured Sphingomonas sp.]CAA9497269.1 MAG: Manganese transport protein MntH [uncultured Sphingomonas sp.]